jgi:LmbE family N-acetylglucosaminyl deacetylase
MWAISQYIIFSGNYDGLGAIRTKELQASAAVLGIHHAETIEHPQMQDGPRSKWPADTVADIVSKYCQQHRIQSVCIFL